MQIAGRLSSTTLGDVLATLHRAGVTGLIKLTETSGPAAGRAHGIYLTQGAVSGVESQAVAMPLGEILRQRGLLDDLAERQLSLKLAAGAHRTGQILVDNQLTTREVVDAALRHQLRLRLEALFRLRDATISFHVACPPPRGVAVRLHAEEYLRGRPRARDTRPERRAARGRDPATYSCREDDCHAPYPRPDAPRWREAQARAHHPGDWESDRSRTEALRTLGLTAGAGRPEITRAFRALARDLHPDCMSKASEAQRREAEQHFARLSAAYHTLLAAQA